MAALAAGPAPAADPYPSWHGYPYQAHSSHSPRYRTPAPNPHEPPVDYWQGLYVGGLVGYGFGTVEGRGDSGALSFDHSGGLAGLLAGYSWRTGAWVYGLEAELKGGSLDGSLLTSSLAASADLNWMASARGRVGYLVKPALLVYGMLGAAWSDFDLRQTTGLAVATQSKSLLGGQIGVGAEMKLTEQWSVRLDYLYTDSESVRLTSPGITNTYEPDLHTLQLGLSFRF